MVAVLSAARSAGFTDEELAQARHAQASASPALFGDARARKRNEPGTNRSSSIGSAPVVEVHTGSGGIPMASSPLGVGAAAYGAGRVRAWRACITCPYLTVLVRMPSCP